jgi:lipopolysaccharide export system protein LptA
VEHKDGKMQLHDVDLTMYGRKGDRADHISGADFEYDEKTQVVRALGVVHLDLQAPPAQEAVALGVMPGKGAATTAAPAKGASSTAAGANGGKAAGAADRVIHITTRGLVYTQKEGLATTDQEIDFTFGGLTGKAIGAQYNSQTGHVVLDTAVVAHGMEHGAAVLLTASHAEMDRQTELATLEHARYSSGGETAEAEVGLVHLRTDGSAERIEGQRHVRLVRDGEGTVTADHGDLSLDPQSKPTLAVLTGTVEYADARPLREGHGTAAQATLHFDGQGRVEHVSLAGGVGKARGGRVESTERVRAAAVPASGLGAAWATRELSADTVELALVSDAAGRAELRQAMAVGSARLISTPVAGGPTKLSGDRLEAQFVDAHGQSEVSTVHGTGHTVLDQVGAKGVEQVSAGDTLAVNFREARAAAKAGAGTGSVASGAVEVATAVQEGNVVLTRTVPAALAVKAAHSGAAVGPDVQHGRAERASFDQDTDLLTLTGAVELWDAASRLQANRVQMEQGSGDATADGAVRVTYQQVATGVVGHPGSGNNSQPTHVLAERAELVHDAGRATFYGAGSGSAGAGAGGAKLARLWQSGVAGEGGSQVEAPMLILEQGEKRLTAKGLGAGSPMAVRTVLVSAPRKAKSDAGVSGVAGQDSGQSAAPDAAVAQGAKAGAKRRGAGSAVGVPKAGETQVVRVTSREMVYSDALRQAEFTGGVRVLDADGDMKAQQATAYLQPAGSKAAGGASGGGSGSGPAMAAAGLMSGGVERIVATGGVDITEPGRHATGERLVYTASDQMFVLTGTAAVPPKVVDAQQGTATGASLRFHSGDDSVVISGEDGGAGQKVRTETKVKQ